MNYKFTANMESDLDKVAAGKLKWVKLLKDFYDPFNKKYLSLNKIDNSKVNHGRYLGNHPETKAKLYAITTKFGHAIQKRRSTRLVERQLLLNVLVGQRPAFL